MHDKFADWYGITLPGMQSVHSPELLQRRWQGIEAACSELGPGDELDLVRLFLRSPQRVGAYATKFRAAFKKVDSGFFTEGNDLEVAVLAGVAIIRRMEMSPKGAGDRAGLAVLCESGVPALSAQTWAVALIAEVDRLYNERCIDHREPYTVTPGQFSTKELQADFDAFAEKLTTGDWTGTQAAAKNAQNKLVNVLTKYATATSKALRQLESEQALRLEETAILWWMTAEYSRDLDKRLADIKLPSAALVAGKELADLVSVPGPFAAKSFLDRALSTCGTRNAHHRQVELKAAVNAVPKAWREKIAGARAFDRVKDLCPVLGAVAHSLATDGAEEWLPVYRKGYQRDPSLQCSGIDLAFQTYREWLLVRSAAEVNWSR